eukprot:scaffold35411_cov56-Phaeocystis_antarctica.AAC.5
MARGSAWSAGYLLNASLHAASELHQSEGEEGEPHAQPQRSRRGAGLPKGVDSLPPWCAIVRSSDSDDEREEAAGGRPREG